MISPTIDTRQHTEVIQSCILQLNLLLSTKTRGETKTGLVSEQASWPSLDNQEAQSVPATPLSRGTYHLQFSDLPEDVLRMVIDELNTGFTYAGIYPRDVESLTAVRL
jgi:hypothetical protein